MRWEGIAIMLIGVIVTMIMAAQAREYTSQEIYNTTDNYTAQEDEI